MNKQDSPPLNDASTPTSREENKPGKSWAEDHGGLIFLIILVSLITLVSLYELFMM